jgi:hypothetical protein
MNFQLQRGGMVVVRLITGADDIAVFIQFFSNTGGGTFGFTKKNKFIFM